MAFSDLINLGMKIKNSEGQNNYRKKTSRHRRKMWREIRQTGLFHDFEVLLEVGFFPFLWNFPHCDAKKPVP